MSPEQNPELFEAIDRLYDIFEPYAFSVDASSDDLGVEDRNRVLHATPLRQLGEEELRRYVFKAMTTWGSVDDFRHLLPRLVELFILQAGRTLFEPEIMFGKLRYGRWTTWPIDEQTALRRFFHVLWRDVLARWPNEPTAILSLSCVAEAEDELLPYLHAWHVAGSRAAAFHFAELVAWEARFQWVNRRRAFRPRTIWGDHGRPAAQLTEWLLAPDRAVDLERAFYAFGLDDDATAGTLSDALNHLWSIRPTAG